MKPLKTHYLWRLFVVAFLIIGGVPKVLAQCTIIDNGGNPAQMTFAVPTLVVNSDAAPGTIITTVDVANAAVTVKCTTAGEIWQGYTVLTNSDLRSDNPLASVYQTNIPGIGFRAAWANNAHAELTKNYLISPWHKGSTTVFAGDTYDIIIHAVIQFVVTGPVSSGLIDTSQLSADWKYVDKVVAQIRFASASVVVQANTCELVEKNITVPLKEITYRDFENNLSPVVSDDRFRIQLEKCAANMAVDYRFTSAGSTGVSGGGEILDIASGTGAAEGVGIQILDQNNQIIKFDSEYAVVAKTTENQSITIPLKARYIKTGTLKGGQVNSVATFEVFYR